MLLKKIMTNTNYKKIIVNKQVYKLSLEYILGLFEGDGSITIQLKSNPRHKTGTQIVLIFEIHQHVIDKDLLIAISNFLGCGKVEIGRRLGQEDSWTYRFRVSSQKEMFNKLLPLLRDQTMVLKKRNNDFNLFLKACRIVEEKKHTTEIGQNEIRNLRSNYSNKLSFQRKNLLPETLKPLNNEWVTGITDAEGSFSFSINRKDNAIRGVNFVFVITQEPSELSFLTNLQTFFKCGNIYTKIEVEDNGKMDGKFYVSSKEELEWLRPKIIPFFETNQLQSIKKHSFLRFKRALEICLNNKPLLPSHYEQLEAILSETTGKRPKPKK
jgi:hypothetical protein